MERDERYEVNSSGELVVGKPNTLSSNERKRQIEEMFTINGWKYTLLDEVTNAHYYIQLDNDNLDMHKKLHLFHGNVRKEDPERSREEKKIQLGTENDPREYIDDAIILGFYVYDNKIELKDSVIVAWPVEREKNYPANPSLRVNMKNDILPAKNTGYYIDKNTGKNLVAFRPEFIYLYLDEFKSLHYEKEEVQLEEGEYTSYLTPEWFNEKSQPLLYLDDEANSARTEFLKKYSPDILKELEGINLLRTIFLNDENKDNLCYQLEFDSNNRELFGSIKSGTAYKYGLHFSKKNSQWVTGTGRNPQFLSVDEAIELGTQIRDYLVDGADIIKAKENLNSLDDYRNLYKELNEATDGYINRLWFLKYYQMIAPEYFPPIYSKDTQTTLLRAIGEKADDNSVVRMGQMQLFINKCDVSSVVFSRAFWSNYDASDFDEEENDTSTPVKFYTGYNSAYARNRVVFGAPGTGKSFTLNKEKKELVGDGNESDYERVTFHPDYSYANFVGTYKPVPCIDSEGRDSITYEYVPGPFMRIYVKALKNSRTDIIKPFLLLIEEINRANVAAVFGDIFQLLDRDEDGVSEYPIQASEDIKNYLSKELGGDPSDYEKIRIPDNLFIWASMNSADQGVFPMDTAFKRRWDFTYLGINDNDGDVRGKTVILGSKARQKVEWNKLRMAINNFLSKQRINEDKQLGPYFIARKIVVPKAGDEIDNIQFISTFKNKVIMYLFEDAAKQKRSSLFVGCFENSNRYSEICREFEEKGIGIFNNEIQLEAEPEDLPPINESSESE